MSMVNQQIVVCTQTDPVFFATLQAAMQKRGGTLYMAKSLEGWVDALDQHFPWLAILDIDQSLSRTSMKQGGELATDESVEDSADGWQTALRRVKLRPHTKYIPLLAVSQQNVEGLAIAEGLGAAEVGLTTHLMPQLAPLLERYFNPPIRYPSGWDEELPTLARQGLVHFNQRDYFEQHELLEDAWRAEERPIRDLYQGILQIGVAFYQIQLGNWKGAIKTFRRALPKLRDLPPTCQGIDIASFRSAAEQIHADITRLGPDRISEFDQSCFPTIQFKTGR